MKVSFDLSDIYRYKYLNRIDRAGLNRFQMLEMYLKEKSHLHDGWFFEEHFKAEHITREEVFLYTRSILATQIQADSDLSIAVTGAIMMGAGAARIVNRAFLESLFPPTSETKYNYEQSLNPRAILSIIEGLESPESLYRSLEDTKEVKERGWVITEFFDVEENRRKAFPTKKFTKLEQKVFICQTLILTSYQAKVEVKKGEKFDILAGLRHAWGRKFSKHTAARDIGTYFEPRTQNCSIEFYVSGKVQDDNDESYNIPWQSSHLPATTPVATRSRPTLSRQTDILPPASPALQTETDQTPAGNDTSSMRRLLSSAKKLAYSIGRVVKRPRRTATPRADCQSDDEEEEDKTPVTKLFLADPTPTHTETETGFTNDDSDHIHVFGFDSPPPEPFSRDEESPNSIPRPEPRILPFRETQTQETTYSEDVFDSQLEREIAPENAEYLAAELAHKSRHELNNAKIAQNVLHLAAVGSSTVQTTMKAVLSGSMSHQDVTEALRASGYSEKKRRLVIGKKQEQNLARLRRAANRGVAPRLVEETCKLAFKNPLSDSSARARSRRYWSLLKEGKDIPSRGSRTNIKVEKVDQLVKWIVENCQFRPGKMRNVRVKGDENLKNLPVYMRYGAFNDLYTTYKEMVSNDLSVGEKSFRRIMKIATVKGTYNQGLSYFYVDFINMTKLLVSMFQRMQQIMKQHSSYIDTEAKKNIEDWIGRARKNTERSRDYLTHHYYADIQKTSDRSWNCAAYALGETSSMAEVSNTIVATDSRLYLALANHVYIYYLVELIFKALPDDVAKGELEDEILSMATLATLSAKDMFHYTKHMMRGWWQDNVVNELKRMLFEFRSAKVCVMDHKNKLLPQSKFEAMSAYFSKAGISILGAMIMWAGQEEKNGVAVDGMKVWFIDIIMSNTTAQEARDLMPCIEAIRSEIQQDYFKSKAGETDCLCFVTDNALTSPSHSPFISALNRQASAIDTENVGTVGDDTDSGINDTSDRSLDNQAFGQSMELPDSSFGIDDDDDQRNQSQQDEETSAARIDAFVVKWRALFSHATKEWQAVEPLIVKWLTFEAQRGKTQLDTHFAYLNKQLTKACLTGNIDYLNPRKVFEALSYKGGARATTTLLLDELDQAQVMFDTCDKAMNEKVEEGTTKAKLRDGISYVHDITFNETGAEYRHFTNLDTGKKVINPAAPITYSAESPLGEILDRNVNSLQPIFFPFKSEKKADKTDRDPSLLSTRVYNALIKYSSGLDISEDEDIAAEQLARREMSLRQDNNARADIDFILRDHKEVVDRFDDLDYPIRLERYWAKKKNKDKDFQLSEEIRERLVGMFEAGQGMDNKKIRYTGEKALMELQHGLLRQRWDQKLIVTIGKIKSFFSRKYAVEQKGNDKLRAATSVKAMEAKLERARTLLVDCKKGEAMLLAKASTFEEATLKDFASIPAPLLKAFIKSRLLVDAGSREMDKSMPNKGTLAQSRGPDQVCPRTGKPYLIRWAFQMRMQPITAKLVESSSEVDQNELDHALFEQGINHEDPPQMVEFLEDVAGDIISENDNPCEVEEAEPGFGRDLDGQDDDSDASEADDQEDE